MKVKKSGKFPEPGYPSQRQFARSKKWIGVAAIGLGAVAGFGAPARTAGVPVPGGKMAVEPRETTPPAAATNEPLVSSPLRTMGIIAVEPRPPGGMPVPPRPAATNLQAGATYVVKPGDTLSGLAARFLGASSRWPEIVALNPGVTPETLKAGQTLVMPAKPAGTNEPVIRLKGEMPSK